MPENNGVNNEEKPNINVNKAQDEKKDGYFAKKNSNANDVGAKIPNNKNKNQNLNGRAYKNPPPAKKAVEGSFNKNEETPAFNSLEGKINKPRGIKRGRMSSSGSDGSVNSSDSDDIEKKNKKKNDSNSDSKNQNNDKNKKKGERDN